MKCFEKINQVNFQNNKKSIFLFPYAGGGTSSFIKWKNYFEDISLYVAQFPGRENKLSQQALVRFLLVKHITCLVIVWGQKLYMN